MLLGQETAKKWREPKNILLHYDASTMISAELIYLMFNLTLFRLVSDGPGSHVFFAFRTPQIQLPGVVEPIKILPHFILFASYYMSESTEGVGELVLV